MNRSEPKKRFAWASLVKESAAHAGFEKVRCPMVGQSFSLRTEVAPSVQVSFQRVTATELAPAVILGICVEAFELEWRDRLLRTDLAPEFESPPFGLHVLNVASLRPRPWSPYSPSDEDVAAVSGWLDRVFEYAKRLPSSIDGLVTAIMANKIADHEVGAYLGHPVKVRGFAQWLRRVHGVDVSGRLLPILEGRTEPYDPDVLLDPD